MAELFTKITGESAGSSPYEFDTITTETGNTFTPSTDQAYAGSYSYKAGFGASTDAAYGRKNLSTVYSSVYLRTQFFITSDFNFSSAARITTIALANGSNIFTELRIRRDSGQSAPNTWVYKITQLGTEGAFTTGFSLGSWIKVAIWYKAATSGNTDGEVKIWIGDTLAIDVTHTYTGTINNARVGGECGISGGTPSAGAFHFDEIECFDAIPSGSSSLPAIINNYRQQGVM